MRIGAESAETACTQNEKGVGGVTGLEQRGTARQREPIQLPCQLRALRGVQVPEHFRTGKQGGKIRVLFDGKDHATHPNPPLDFAASVSHVDNLVPAVSAMTQPNPLLAD